MLRLVSKHYTALTAAGLGLGVMAAALLAVSAGEDGGDRVVVQAEAPPRVPAESGLGALLVQYSMNAPGWDAAVTPLESATLDGIPRREPLALGLQGSGLVSPDGSLMAYSNWQKHEGDAFLVAPTGAVTLFDVEAWKPAGTIGSEPGVMLAAWAADGAHVYGTRSYCAAPASEGRCPGGWQRDLWVFDVVDGTARQVVELDFEPRQWHFHGDRAVTLGVRTEICCGIDPQGDPFVTVVDLSAGEIEAEIPLPGMLIGQPKHWLGDMSMYASYHPASALSPHGSRLYVVDPVEDEVRVVDLEAMAITETVGFGEERSGLAGFGDWLLSQVVSTAEAKGNPSHMRQARVTPDGRYLVISGVQAQEEDPIGSRRHWTDRPTGLVVIETGTMKVKLRESGVGWFEVSPDGRWILGTGFYYDEALMDENGLGGLVPFGLKVIDTSSGEVVAHLWPDEVVSVAGLSPDGRYAYIQTDGPGMEASRQSPPPKPHCGPDCWRVHVLNLENGEVVAVRSLGEHEGIMALIPWR